MVLTGHTSAAGCVAAAIAAVLHGRKKSGIGRASVLTDELA
jgi:hypothetical protein